MVQTINHGVCLEKAFCKLRGTLKSELGEMHKNENKKTGSRRKTEHKSII